VRKILSLVIAVCLVGASVLAWDAAQQTVRTAAPGQAAAMSVDDVLKAVRADLQGSRADIMAKNITLTAEQAAKFWPLFEQYQKEQNLIMDEQMKGIQRYVDTYETLDDAGALALIKTHLDRDAQMQALRLKWLPEFQKVVPAKIAARVIQIDRRLSFVHQVEFSARIPLIH
jgi:Spy/CpxP family protein refolding chaperone